MNADDAQALRDVHLFLRELLAYADVLPADLAAMLCDYQSGLRGCPPWRSDRMGDSGQYERVADLMAQRLTDGQWAGGGPWTTRPATCTPGPARRVISGGRCGCSRPGARLSWQAAGTTRGRAMNVPDRETARRVTWMTEMLLAHGGNALPVGLRAALREYKSALLIACAGEEWARAGHPSRYGRLADLIAQQVEDGEWKPGQRMPSRDHLAAQYGVNPETAKRALHVLAVRGVMALEAGSYYVLPRGMHLPM